MVKMKTRLAIEGSFGNIFLLTYNYCRVMAAWSRKALKIFKFLRFCRKTTPYGEVFKILFRNDLSRHPSTECVQVSCSSSAHGETGKIMRCLADNKKKQNFAWLSSSCYCTDCAQNLPEPSRMYSECSRFHPDEFIFVGDIPERMNTVNVHSKVFPIFSWSLASSRIIIHWKDSARLQAV